jgi:hypothetical protein
MGRIKKLDEEKHAAGVPNWNAISGSAARHPE